jgi:hypothetical protein
MQYPVLWTASGAGAATVTAIQINSDEKDLASNFDTDAGATTIDTISMSGLKTLGLSSF